MCPPPCPSGSAWHPRVALAFLPPRSRQRLEGLISKHPPRASPGQAPVWAESRGGTR